MLGKAQRRQRQERLSSHHIRPVGGGPCLAGGAGSRRSAGPASSERPPCIRLRSPLRQFCRAGSAHEHRTEPHSRRIRQAVDRCGGRRAGRTARGRDALRGQAERLLNSMDVVQREEFEAVREMALKAREENKRPCRAHRRARGEGSGAATGLRVRSAASPAAEPRRKNISRLFHKARLEKRFGVNRFTASCDIFATARFHIPAAGEKWAVHATPDQ